MQREEYALYQRQIALPEVGLDGQRLLKSKSVLLVGAGGLGSPSAVYLAAAGLGRIGLIDGDRVHVSNLHRQILYTWADAEKPKTEAASHRLLAQNPFCAVEAFPVHIDETNADEIIAGFDLVVEGSDNFKTKYLVNAVCAKQRKPLILASVMRSEGQLMVFDASQTRLCYQCVFPEPPGESLAPNCADAGVLGVVPGLLGTMQATEALRYFLNMGRSSVGKLRLWDTAEMRFESLDIAGDPDCPVCNGRPSPLPAVPDKCLIDSDSNSLSPGELKKMRDALLIDVRSPTEFEGGTIEGAVNMNWEQFQALQLPRNSRIAVFCLKGQRSQKFLNDLKAAGYKNACHLRGGYIEWLITFGEPQG